MPPIGLLTPVTVKLLPWPSISLSDKTEDDVNNVSPWRKLNTSGIVIIGGIANTFILTVPVSFSFELLRTVNEKLAASLPNVPLVDVNSTLVPFNTTVPLIGDCTDINVSGSKLPLHSSTLPVRIEATGIVVEYVVITSNEFVGNIIL